ncbi:MAG: nicotinate (nicotinamide) nucleotide adenylyltransferase [Opitutales bacterium]|nr:nicotinate (nicotinamide) nucleotide adenylyltransferase [Opitutales bacterium]
MERARKTKIGILGGSFDPPHLGHIGLAKTAVEAGAAEKIVFIPAGQAPLRDAPTAAPASRRLAMLKIALSRFPYPHEIDECEIGRGGVSYAIDTAKLLKKRFPEAELRWIVGADHIEKLAKWRDIGELAKIVSFACARRDGFPADAAKVPSGVNVEFFDFAPMPHSSTQIRADLASGKRNLFMLDPAVEKYIVENKLYNS